PLESGDALVHPAYQAGKKAIEDAASDAGYLDARFETAEIRVDLAQYRADVVLHLKTGHRFFFGPAVFRQNIVDADLVAGYLNWDRGDPFDMGKVLQFQNALADAPYFERVEVETPRDEAEDFQIPVIATLTPARRTRYVFGAGYGTDTGFRGTLGAQFRRLNRRGHRAEAELRYSELERGVEGRYLIPGPYPRTDVITFRGAYAEQRTDTSRSDGWLVGAGIAQSRGAWRESFSLNYQQEKFEIGVDRGTSRLLVPEASWTRIQADDRIFATRGWRIEFLGRVAHESAGSDATFLQLEARGKIIHSLTPRHRLIGRVDLGHIVTQDFRRLPARIRYFAGGDRSVRGYGFHELGRRDREGNVIGGETLAVASIEYEFWFRPKWAAALFFDAGDAARGFPSAGKKAAGVGGRWRSPIGPVRLDVGFGFDDPKHAAVVHLTVGPDL
ncbi:MAG TPA: BamA/TamA family outer membrane protein, partial [Thermoanaerobaculia bacterium]|nr:BamA/TamA family outer membrane protein [Thermoanaerobaculia bacterium]